MADNGLPPRFGVILNSLEGKYQSDVLRGILTALEGKANVLVVVIRELSTGEDERKRLLAHLPDPGLVGGVIVLSTALRLQPADVALVRDHFRRTDGRGHVVSVGLQVPGVPSILVDDEAGVQASVRHLIKVHGCKQIGFIRGPEENGEAERRLAAFKLALDTNGISEEGLISRPGSFSFEWGFAAAEEMLGAWPRLHAVVGANDDIARGALVCVNRKYEHAPRPAVIGFDDTELAVGTEPPLTTVRQPLELEGWLAAHWMLRLNCGERARSLVRLGTRLRIRESCGCAVGASDATAQIDAWLSQLAPDRKAAARLRRALRRDANAAERLRYLEAEVERLVLARAQRATSSDTGALRHALSGLRDISLGTIPEGDPRAQSSSRFWQAQLDLVATRGSMLALQSEDRRSGVRHLRETDAAVPGEFAKLLTRVGLSEHWICAPPADGVEAPGFVVLSGARDMGETIPPDRLIPSYPLPDAAICYALEFGGKRGRLVFQLGPANDWWSYEEVREAAEAFCKRQLDPGGTPSRSPDAVAPSALEEPAHVQKLLKIKDGISKLFNRLESAVSPKSASLQLIDGDTRLLVQSFGFSGESRSLLRPISCDALISRLLREGKIQFAADANQLVDWQPIEGIGAWIGAPILRGTKPIGLLTVDFAQPIPDIEKYKTAIEGLVGDAKPLLEQGRPLFREEQLSERTRLVQRTMSLVAQKLEPQELLQTIVDEVARLVNCSHCTVFFPHRTDDKTTLVAEYASHNATLSRRFGDKEGIAGYVWQTGETVLITDAHKDKRYAPPRRKPEHDVAPEKRSMLVVPISAGDQIIGIISADQDAIGWFQDRDARLVEALAQQAGIAIQRSQAIRSVQDIATSILSADTSSAILQNVAAAAVKIANADAGVIYHLSDDKRSIRDSFPRHSDHPEPRLNEENGLTNRIIREQVPIAIKDLSDPESGANPKLAEMGFKSLIGVPLIDEDIIGVLFVDDRNSHVFNDSEISLLRILAGLAAIALRRATRWTAERGNLPPIGVGVGELLNAEVSTCVYLWDAETGTFHSPHADGPLKSVLEMSPREEGTGRYVIDTGEPIFQPDARKISPPIPPVRDQAKAGGIRSFAALPLKYEKRIVGVLFVASQRPIQFLPEQQDLLKVFARHIAPATAHATRYARQKSVARRVIVRMNRHVKDYDLLHHELTACASAPKTHIVEDLGIRLRKTTVGLKRLLGAFHTDGAEVQIVREWTSLNQLVKHAAADHHQTSTCGLEPKLKLDQRLDDALELDPRRIADCLRRLLSNADRAVAQAAAPEIRLFTKIEEDGRVAFGVEDSGGGFPPGVNVTAPFEGTYGDGLGLGLTFVHAVAQAHGGQLECGRSPHLPGAIVTVRMPRFRGHNA